MKAKVNYNVLGFCILNIAFLLFWIIPNVGSQVYTKCTRYHICARYLRSSGYPFYYTTDHADAQWKDIRSNLFLLWTCLILISMGHYVVKVVFYTKLNTKNENKSNKERILQKNARVSSSFRVLVGLIFLFVMHKWHMHIVMVIALITFQLAMSLKGAKYARLFVWLFALSLLLLKECYRIKHYINIPIVYWMFDHHNYGGMYAWQFPANFLVLRVISYCVDYFDAVEYHSTRQKVKKMLKLPKEGQVSSSIQGGNYPENTENPDNFELVPEFHRPVEEYENVIHFLSYLLYTPLYMAGPIISYNAFIYYSHYPNAIKENVLVYAVRWLGCFLVMEYLSNHYPFFAVLQARLLPYLSVSEMAIVAYVVLKMMWLKFLLIWRFFRLWALADGCNPPENMLKCMSNNCSLGEFWRSWHASFNQWIIRYMYVPLGGRSTRMLNIWFIFLFVALWHDIEYKLIVWGLLNASFYVLEVLGSMLINSEFVTSKLSQSFIKLLGIFSSATYIIILICVNLVGYSMLGTDGTSLMLQKILSWDGLQTIIAVYYFLFIGVWVMNWYQTFKREWDRVEVR